MHDELDFFSHVVKRQKLVVCKHNDCACIILYLGQHESKQGHPLALGRPQGVLTQTQFFGFFIILHREVKDVHQNAPVSKLLNLYICTILHPLMANTPIGKVWQLSVELGATAIKC